MNIALLSKHFKAEICDIMKKIISEIWNFDCRILMQSHSSRYFTDSRIIFFDDTNVLIEKSDVVFVVGGDGTIIHYAKEAAKLDKPVFGINGGTLGFLATCEKDEMLKIQKVLRGEYSVNKRLMLEVEFKNKKIVVLNDIVVNRDVGGSVLKYNVLRDERLICSYSADGIIFATPTGSTAYSLSAGGPIADRNLECMVLTPICPHTLASRSMVLNAGGELCLSIQGSQNKNNEFFISVDGDTLKENLNENRIIKIKKSKFKAGFIELKNYNFYDKIRKKLIGDNVTNT